MKLAFWNFSAFATPFIFAVTLASAQEPAPLPPGVTPTLAVIESFDAKARLGKLLYGESKPVFETVQKDAVGPDGKTSRYSVIVCKYVTELKLRLVTITGVREASGEKLADEQISARLQKGTPVVVVPDGARIDPVYRQVIAKDAILVYVTSPPPPTTPPSTPPIPGP